MGTTGVTQNTDPESSRRLEAGGPMAFVMAVQQTLERLERPYLFAGSVPHYLDSDAADAQESRPENFREHYNQFRNQTPRRDFREVEHAIIHQHRRYPMKMGDGGVSDSPTGAGRQKTPSNSTKHDRPLPSSAEEAPEPEVSAQPALEETPKRPPLWDSKEQVPDLIEEHVDEDTMMYVTQWEYDVFVDFVLVAANQWLLTDMERDMLTILKTFHERWATGASNISGWFFQQVNGTPPEIDDVRDDYPTTTLTWRLQQTEAYAFPLRELEDIELGVFGQPMRKFSGV